MLPARSRVNPVRNSSHSVISNGVKSMKNKELKKGEIIIYKADSNIKVDVKLNQDTVWLSLDQMAILFDRDKSVISRHIKNTFTDKELERKSVVANFATTAADGKTYDVEYFNLDVIISVGYRVKSNQGVKFRIWATSTLKSYLLKGYTINEKRLLEAQSKFEELKSAVEFLKNKAGRKLVAGQEKEILNLLADYSKTLTLLEQYDTEKVVLSKSGKGIFVLNYSDLEKIIASVKINLINKKEAGEFFGQENGEKLKGLMGAIYQTFDKKELYPSIEEKAAHLLYFVIKDHPFVDGNKRIASFLFVYFLDKSKYLYRGTGEKKINDNGLAALALLIAISDPKEKDKLIKIVTNLLK